MGNVPDFRSSDVYSPMYEANASLSLLFFAHERFQDIFLAYNPN